MNFSRRRWLGRSVFYGLPLFGFGYGNAVEKGWLTTPRTVVPLSPRHSALHGLKLAIMGDFHHDDFGSQRLIRAAVEAVNDARVDLVLLVGDYISSDTSAIVALCEELAGLKSRLGTFAVFGNHDRLHYAPLLDEAFLQAGIRVLNNEVVAFPGFALAGIDSYLTRSSNLPQALDQVAEDLPVLLAWHEPDTFDFYDDPRVALQVSGHTHGGQICAPILGPLVLPALGKKYPHGLYRQGERSLFVTRGIGTLSIPARFLCPPEAAILELRAEA